MQQILQHLFNKRSLQEIEPGAVETVAREYPYFAAAQYFYTRELQVEKQPVYARQLQKTLLYFNNPLWLKYQLDQAGGSMEGETLVPELSPSLDYIQPGTLSAGSSPDMIEDVVLHQEKNYAIDEEGPIHSKGFDSIDRALAQTSSEMPGLVHPAQQETTASQVHNTLLTTEDVGDVQTSASMEEAAQDITDDQVLPSGDLPLQAYHTVDYFASQGIKLSQEALANDKLGKQMKSFTEWLKTMRRLPEPVAEEVFEKVNDSDIAKYAAHSLEEKEVVTEAMAEVFAKQGKTARAIEVYQKLSLRNLSKSAYFAAKIEGLKQH